MGEIAVQIKVINIEDLSRTVIVTDTGLAVNIDKCKRELEMEESTSYEEVIQYIFDRMTPRMGVVLNVNTNDGEIEVFRRDNERLYRHIRTCFACLKYIKRVAEIVGRVSTIEIGPDGIGKETNEEIVLDSIDSDSFYRREVTVIIDKGINGTLNLNKLLESKYLNKVEVCREQKRNINGNTDKVKGKEVIIDTLMNPNKDKYDGKTVIDISNRYIEVSATYEVSDEVKDILMIMKNCIFKDTIALLNTIFMSSASKFDLTGARIENVTEINMKELMYDFDNGNYLKAIIADGKVYEEIKRNVRNLKEVSLEMFKQIESRSNKLGIAVPKEYKRVLIKS